MSAYILDMIVNSGQFTDALELNETPVWVMFKVDGTNSSVSTHKSRLCSNVIWNFKVRLTPIIRNLETSYMYVNLCTLSKNREQITSVAVSKLCLKNFPVGNPRSFSFPLLSTSNTAIQVGKIKLTATLSTFIDNFMRNQRIGETCIPAASYMHMSPNKIKCGYAISQCYQTYPNK